MKKRFLLFLTFCIAVGLLPLAAYAAPGDGWRAEDGGWRYYRDGVPLKNVNWIETEGRRYIFDGATGLLLTGDAEGDVLAGGNLYYINPDRDPEDPASCYAVRNYTRDRGRTVGVTYYDGDGITFVGWINAPGGGLRYQTCVPKENVPGATKDIYIYVWRVQNITEVRPDPNFPADRSKDIPAGWYLFDDDGVWVREDGFHACGDGYDYLLCGGQIAGWQPGAIPGREARYVLNRNTDVFHAPGCTHVNRILPEHRMLFSGTREEASAAGYRPCGVCRP